MSQFHLLDDSEIAESISENAKTLRACLLDSRSTYLVLTVPAASPFRASEKLTPILGNLSRIGMLPRLYKATDSEDIQIYIAFSEPVKTEEMSKKISAFLGSCGFEQGSNMLVVHTCEQPFALPLQPGFAWLNESLEPKVRREEVSLPAAIAVFLRDLDNSTACPQQIEAALETESHSCFQNEKLTCSDDIAIASSINSSACEVAPEVEIETAIKHVSESAMTEELALDFSVPAAAQIVGFPTQEIAVTDSLPSMQLLLFPTAKQPETSALPKGRPKRGKRPRSNLPDSSDAVTPARTKVFPIDLLANTASTLFEKGVFENE
jgi:hypothetical protein